MNPALKHAHFGHIVPTQRQRLEFIIEALIDFLDRLDGDVDLEPSLADSHPGYGDRELDLDLQECTSDIASWRINPSKLKLKLALSANSFRQPPNGLLQNQRDAAKWNVR